MNLHQLYLTENDCYKANRWITPKGVMVHSTGAENPNLKRYVGPDDGFLGVNQNNNHWNRPGVGPVFTPLSGCWRTEVLPPIRPFPGICGAGTAGTMQTAPTSPLKSARTT